MVKKINLLSSKIIDNNTSTADIIKLLLQNRGIKNIDDFLKPPLPSIKLNLIPSVKIIKEAIKNNHNILIYGDYDVDGITATAILWQAIHKIYPNVTPFIPHREIDGYGIKAKSFFRFQEEKHIKFDLLITVDNGIVADKELQKIKEKQNIKIIVTDHHEKPIDTSRDVINHVSTNKKSRFYDAVVHSTQLCGSAISYFLAKEFDNDADLGLAALGTVADCLPLVGLNRSIVVHGLRKLNTLPSPGIKKLIQVSSVQLPVSSYHLGFILGPRINAVGRLSDPTDALRLLCSNSETQASQYAQVLNSYNQDRQAIQKESLDIADDDFRKGAPSGRPTNRIIIIDGDYNPGIIGLISGRLTEKYYLPSVVIAVDGDIAKGSCRSIPELNIINALREHSDLFIDLGGHSGAAGFSIKTSNISKLKKILTKSVNSKLDKIHLVPHLDVDSEMNLNAVNLKNIKIIDTLAPFGIGNPQPLFLFKNITVDSVRTIGQNNDHLKISVRADRCVRSIDTIAFKQGQLINKIKTGDSVDLVASLSINEWNNTITPQLIIKEIILD